MSAGAVARATPSLLASGAGGLGWWRLRHSRLRRSRRGVELRQAYRHQSILAAVHERQIEHTLEAFRTADVEPLLVKGWAVARLYPEIGLRPYGDIDLRVRATDEGAATAARDRAIAAGCPVDLRVGLHLLGDRSWDEVWNRSSLVTIGRTEVRIPGPEDHLRLLCLHLLNHGAWRPLWLCDVAAFLEAYGEELDWDYFFKGDRFWSRLALCSLMLAHRLLGARLDQSIIANHKARVPPWLVSATLTRWGERHRHREPLFHHLRTRSGIVAALRASWPDPITATVCTRGPMNTLPRFPFQLIRCATRTAQICAKLLVAR